MRHSSLAVARLNAVMRLMLSVFALLVRDDCEILHAGYQCELLGPRVSSSRTRADVEVNNLTRVCPFGRRESTPTNTKLLSSAITRVFRALAEQNDSS